MLKSANDYYLKRGNDKVFVCALDLSKAYDRVPYYNLFITLLEMGLPVYFVRLLSVWYEKQTMHVKWKTQLSKKFTVGNGVQQGSVLFPSFFYIYIENLLIRLQNCGYGGKVGPAFVGCLAYADDVTLISPTLNGTQRMLDICTSFATEKGLLFNSKKGFVTLFVRNRRI